MNNNTLTPAQESFVKMANEKVLLPKLLVKILFLYKVNTASPNKLG